MKKALFLIFILFSTQATRAQTFELGYLVLSHGDTLRGEVENGFWEDPPKKVDFRNNATAPITTYAARQLRSVYLSSGRLLRHELLPIDRYAETRTDRLLPHLRRNQQPDSVLTDVLVMGEASLLGVTLDQVKHFFVRRQQQPYLELTERKYLQLRNGHQYEVDANDYRTQLLVYFGNCAEAIQAADAAPFTAAGLTRVVQAYNLRCSATRRAGRETTPMQAVRPRVAWQLGVLGGARYNTVRLRESYYSNNVPGLNLDKRVHPQVGAYADLLHPGRRFAFHTALLVSSFGRRSSPDHPLDWRGVLAMVQVGPRAFFKLTPSRQLILGLGYEILKSWQTAGRFTTSNTYVTDFNYKLRGSPIPYLELGAQADRWLLTLTGRIYSDRDYSFRYSGTNMGPGGLPYSTFPASLSLTAGYSLRNSDAQKAP